MIYMIQNGTGNIFKYLALPNLNGSPGNPQTWPGLGNISYDGDRDQLFVTNMEDGKIYRVAGTGGFATSQATWLSTFDPNNPTDGWTTDAGAADPGIAPLGDRLWAVQYHQGRVYFSRWRVDGDNPNPAIKNEIWSVGTQASGDFDGIYGRELEVPHYGTGNAWSMPVSDMSFGPRGQMMLAERGVGGMGGADYWSYPWRPHEARGLEYACKGDGWVPSGLTYGVGGWDVSSSGGTDYDYDTRSIIGNPNTGPRVWFTMNAAFSNNGTWYGITGIKFNTGGDQTTSILNDADGLSGTYSKTWIGDVELPCPPRTDGTISGRVQLKGLSIEPTNRAVTVQLVSRATGTVLVERETTLDSQGRFQIMVAIPTEPYDIKIDAKCYLRRIATQGPAGVEVELIPGDIDGDNAVTVLDYIVLSQSFDISADDPLWLVPGALGIPPAESDIDGDGAITIFDYILLSEHFDQVGQ